MEERLFADFNFALLKDPRFKEESVREDLIAPLIRYLGYTNSGNTQVIRDHGLKHPFVSIGTSRKSITIIPDYLLKVAEKPAWILEAKTPSQSVNEPKHLEQAYSYAIHPEIRVNYFALCNGREFVLYNISEEKPMVHIPMQSIDDSKYKEFLKEILSPTTVFQTRNVEYRKDLGLHIKRLGYQPSDRILAVHVKPAFIVKYNENLFSFPSPVGMNEEAYMGSFDFDLKTAQYLRPIVGDQLFIQLMQPNNGRLLKFHFPETFLLNVSISLPENETLYENNKEIYLPVIVKEFLPI